MKNLFKSMLLSALFITIISITPVSAADYKITKIDIYPNLISLEISKSFNNNIELTLPATFIKDSIKINYALSKGIKDFNVTTINYPDVNIKLETELDKDIEKLAKEIDKLEGKISGLKFSTDYLDRVEPSSSSTALVAKEIKYFMTLKSSYITQSLSIEREAIYKKSILKALVTERIRLYPANYNKSIKIQATGGKGAKLVFQIESGNIIWKSAYRLFLNSSTGVININHYLNIVQKTMIDLKGDMTFHMSPINRRDINTVLNPKTVDIRKIEVMPKPKRVMASKMMFDEDSVMEMRMSPAGNIQNYDIVSDFVGVKMKLNTSLPSRLISDNILIDQYVMNSKPEIIIIPSAYEFAILNAEIKEVTKPLYAGMAELYIDNTYTSDQYINTALIGSDLKIPFGLLESISVKREDTISKTDEGFIKDYKDYGYDIKITNFNKDIKSAKIIDRIPLSINSKLKVEDVVISGVHTVSDTGIVEWILPLPSNKEVKLDVKYRLKYPSGSNIITR